MGLIYQYENAIMLFCSSFTVILLLGLQSQYVRLKQVIPSLVTSTLVGICQIYLYKEVHDSNTIENIAFVSGGVLGTIGSIFLYTFLTKYIKHEEK
jgi:Na+/proline symporter